MKKAEKMKIEIRALTDELEEDKFSYWLLAHFEVVILAACIMTVCLSEVIELIT